MARIEDPFKYISSGIYVGKERSFISGLNREDLKDILITAGVAGGVLGALIFGASSLHSASEARHTNPARPKVERSWDWQRLERPSYVPHGRMTIEELAEIGSQRFAIDSFQPPAGLTLQ